MKDLKDIEKIIKEVKEFEEAERMEERMYWKCVIALTVIFSAYIIYNYLIL